MQTYLIGARDNQTNDEDTDHVEDYDAPKRPTDCSRDILPWVLRLADGHPDKLGPNVCQQRVGECAPKSEENGQMKPVYLVEQVGSHRSIRVAPVAEAVAIMVRVSAKVNDDPHEDESHEARNLEHAKTELALASM